LSQQIGLIVSFDESMFEPKCST